MSREQLAQQVLRDGFIDGLPADHFIDGVSCGPVNGRRMGSFDPARGDAFAAFARGDGDDVEQAVASAARALAGHWRRLAPAERGRILHRVAESIAEQADYLAVVECLDTGKPLREAAGDVAAARRTFEYYAGACDKLQGDTFPLAPGYLGYSLHEPAGVTAHVIPWNFPLTTAARGIAPALAAGCTVVAKPAEQTPFTALLLARLARDAGLPEGVFNVVTGTGAEAGAPLVAHPRVDHVTFTGSVATGQAVMRAAAEPVTRVVLELGGKSPVVVLADCDRERAVDGVLGAIYCHAGQVCSAGSRLVIERSIHEPFLDALLARVARLVPGHGLRDAPLGPLISQAQRQRVDGFLARARERGARVLAGGRPTCDPESGKGWFFEPTVVLCDDPGDELVQEEIFGPVLTVQVADDAAHALALANGTRYGLVAGIFTADVHHALTLARDLDVGQVFINEYFAGGIELPFGGNRQSGFGREKGMEGLRSYCRTKSVAVRL